MDFLAAPLGWILRQLSQLTGGNFAITIFLFTLLVNALMIPLSIKSQKSAMGQMRIKPKMDALKKKYGDDRQRYSTELQKLYQKENVSMSGGCLPMIIRLVIMMGVYSAVLSPITSIMQVDSATVKTAAEAAGINATGYFEPQLLRAIAENNSISAEIANVAQNFSFNFFGIDLTTTPSFNVDIINNFNINWLIPILAFAAAMLSSFISMSVQKKTNPGAPSMKGMMYTMPFISLILGFTLSCAAGFYWACSSLISGLLQAFVQIYYGPRKMISVEQSKDLLKRFKSEKEIIVKAKAE